MGKLFGWLWTVFCGVGAMGAFVQGEIGAAVALAAAVEVAVVVFAAPVDIALAASVVEYSCLRQAHSFGG